MNIRLIFRALVVVVVLCLSALAAQAAPPVATSFSATASTVGATLLQLQGSDADGTALTFAIVAAPNPAHGSLSALNASTGYVVFTPATGYTGVTTFTFNVTSGGDTSSTATATITVTSAKTRIVDTLVDPAGNPRSGKVTFILTQRVTSPAGVIPVGSTVSATLNGSGQFDISVYPSSSLSPQAYYQVWFEATGSLRRELIGVYQIPASTATQTLAPNRVTNTALAAQYTFIDQAAINTILSTASGAAAIYTGTPTDNVLQRYDAATGKLENSPVTATDSTVTINTTSGVAINASGLQPAAALQVDSTTRGLLPPRLTTVQRTAMPEVQQGLHLFNTTTNRPNFFTTGWEEGAYLSDLNALNASNLSSGTVPLARLSGITNAQIDAAAAIDWSKVSKTGSSLADLVTRSASDLSSGTLPDARFPATLPAVSGANLTSLNASNLSSGTVASARLGSGGAGAGTKFLADNQTWVLPESLGLLDASSPTDGAYPIFLNSHTLGNGYLKQEANGVGLDGTASGPYFNIYANGTVGASNYSGLELYTETSLVRLGARRGGTFASQDISVQLNALGNGTLQFNRGGTNLWTINSSGHLIPTGEKSVGSQSNPISELGVGGANGVAFYNSNVEVGRIFSGGLDTIELWGSAAVPPVLRFGLEGPTIRFASASPEGFITANVGSLYADSSLGKLYIKESGIGDTGWVEVGGGGVDFGGLTTNIVPAYDGSEFIDSPITASIPGSMVNGITVTGGATTASPTIAATGSATNLHLIVKSKGTGGLRFGDGSGTGTDAPALYYGGTPFGLGLQLGRGDGGSFDTVAFETGQVNGRTSLLQWDGANYNFIANSAGASLASDKQFLFSSTTSANGSKDAGFKRDDAGKIRATNGSSGDGIVISGGADMVDGRLNSFTFDFNTASQQTLYTCPTGKTCVITKVVPRNPSANVTSNVVTVQANGVDWASFNFSTVTLNTNGMVVMLPASSSGIPDYGTFGSSARLLAAGQILRAAMDSGVGSAITGTFDVFGYIY